MTILGITRRLLLGAVVFAPMLALAQPPGPPDDGPPPPRGRRGGPGGGPGDDRPRPSGPADHAALDTNHDGELSAEEIRKASSALKALDHNHDGVLDRSELEPRRWQPAGPTAPRMASRRTVGGPRRRPDGPRMVRWRTAARWPRWPAGRRTAPGAGRGRPGIGHVLPPFVRDELSLTDRQLKQIAELENDVKGKLESILTADQLRQFRASPRTRSGWAWRAGRSRSRRSRSRRPGRSSVRVDLRASARQTTTTDRRPGLAVPRTRDHPKFRPVSGAARRVDSETGFVAST